MAGGEAGVGGTEGQRAAAAAAIAPVSADMATVGVAAADMATVAVAPPTGDRVAKVAAAARVAGVGFEAPQWEAEEAGRAREATQVLEF